MSAHSSWFTNVDEIDWTPCENGPFFITGYPCCAGHARARAESGDVGWWSDTSPQFAAFVKNAGAGD